MPADGTLSTALGIDGVPAALPEPWVEFLGDVPDQDESNVVTGNTVVFRVHNDTWSTINISDPTIRSVNIGSLLATSSPANGWNLQIRAKESTGVGVWSLPTNTDLTWTLSPLVGSYDIASDEELEFNLAARLNTNWRFQVGTDGWGAPTVFTIFAAAGASLPSNRSRRRLLAALLVR